MRFASASMGWGVELANGYYSICAQYFANNFMFSFLFNKYLNRDTA